MVVVDLDAVLATDPAELAGLGDAGLEEELVELGRLREQVQAAYLDRLRAFHQRGVATERGLSTRSWAANELQVAPRETSRDLAAARTPPLIWPNIPASATLPVPGGSGSSRCG